MRKKTEEEVKELIKELTAHVPGLISDRIQHGLDDFIGSDDGVLNKRIDDRLKLMLKDHKFLKTVGTHMAVAEAHRLADKRERALEELSEKEIEMRDSPEPWFDMIMFGHDAEKGAKIQTEWNNAFIHYLRGLGFRGQDEEQMVQHYIGMIGAEAMASEIDA